MPLLGKSGTIEIEDCPICSDVFKEGAIVYRPFVNGGPGKAYHKGCLEEWCAKSGEPCVDPMTTIKFNISSKIKCNYSRPYRITLHAEDERILLGTEPCDQFYDIKKFMSSNYNIPMKTITLWKIEGNERMPVVDSEFIGDDLDLDLSLRPDVDDMSFADLYDDNYKRGKKTTNVEQIAKELTQLESLEKTEHLSSEEITNAAQQAVEVEDGEDSEEIFYDASSSTPADEDTFYDVENSIDFEIRSSKERLDELEHTLTTLSRDDPKRSQLESIQEEEKTRYKKLLVKGILTLFENVKHVLSQFLSRSGDFVTDPETHEQLQQFVSYVLRLLATGMYSVLRLIAVLGWEICKLIPRIIKYALAEKNEDYDEPPYLKESENKQGFFSSFFSGSKGNDDPDPDPIGVFQTDKKIRQKDAPNVRDALERREDVSSSVYDGLRKGDVFRKGFFFRNNKHSKRMRRHRKMRK
jgi:hypothetical protein